jgi:hypothetical protein
VRKASTRSGSKQGERGWSWSRLERVQQKRFLHVLSVAVRAASQIRGRCVVHVTFSTLRDRQPLLRYAVAAIVAIYAMNQVESPRSLVGRPLLWLMNFSHSKLTEGACSTCRSRRTLQFWMLGVAAAGPSLLPRKAWLSVGIANCLFARIDSTWLRPSRPNITGRTFEGQAGSPAGSETRRHVG